MKEYVITVKGQPYHVVIKKMQTDTAIVEVDGDEYEVGVERKVKRQVEPLDVKPVRKEPETQTTVSSASIPAETKTVTGEGDVVAPLPGLILKVLVKVGDRVKTGQTLIKMEAMKMENEIKANKDGVVQQILVKEDEAVSENATLVKIGD